jgi:hypothetical protein
MGFSEPKGFQQCAPDLRKGSMDLEGNLQVPQGDCVQAEAHETHVCLYLYVCVREHVSVHVSPLWGGTHDSMSAYM